jgi:hypothetical protein
LAHIPADASAFLSVRVADLWDLPTLRDAKERLLKEDPSAFKQIASFSGVEPAEVERVTIFVRDIGPNMAPAAVVTTVSPYDRKKVLATMGASPVEEKRKGRTLYTDARSQRGLYLIDDRTFVLGALSDVQTVVDAGGAAAEGPLSGALRLATGKKAVVAGIVPGKIKELFGEQLPPQVEPFSPLLEAKVATVSFDPGAKLKAELTMSYGGETAAKDGAKALKTGLEAAGVALTLLPKGQVGPAGAEVLKRLAASLQGATVDVRGTSIRAEVVADSGTKEISDSLLEVVAKARVSARRVQSVNNLKQIALAMHNYHDTYASFPATAVYDKDGKALLSWRVLILPFIEQGALFKEFHLDEPWDSDHNKKLIARMPAVYKSDLAAKEGETYHQGFDGPGAFFDAKKGIKISDITDGTSNTFMVIESARSVPWTKPEDIAFDPAKPLPKLGFREDGFYAAYCDGSVRFMKRDTKQETLKATVTRNGGEVIDNGP